MWLPLGYGRAGPDELGARLRAQRHRREHPQASDEDARRVVIEWLANRARAPIGTAWAAQCHGSQDVSSIEAALRQLVNDLQRSKIGFAFVGGLAVSARAEPRLTRDAYVAVSVADNAEAENVVHRPTTRAYVLPPQCSSTRAQRA